MGDLENLTREQLMEQIKALKSHNTQLLNIISKNNPKPTSTQTPRKEFDFSKCFFKHVLLKFLYLGWDYQGFVVQEHTTQTIEHEIFKALQKTCFIKDRASANYHRCGRTDKGVSSFSQVISLDLRDTGKSTNYCKILNRVLPDNIQFVASCTVEENFSARFNCDGRVYKYYFPKGDLDIEKMQKAANYLEGVHDFRNLCKMDVGNGVVEFTRSISSAKICYDDDFYSMCVLRIEGKAFLWHQIRCIMGILLLVGQGEERPEIVRDLLDIKKTPRKPDFSMASEIPLNLYKCHYENIQWEYDDVTVGLVLERLRRFWTFSAIKTAMVKDMIDDLERETGQGKICLAENLIQGIKRRKYVPVMKRQLCDSLEDKIKHFAKRGKINPPSAKM